MYYPRASLCVDGYFEQFGVCVACPASSSASSGQVAGIVLLLVAVCAVLFQLRTLLPVDVLKLGLSMLQVWPHVPLSELHFTVRRSAGGVALP